MQLSITFYCDHGGLYTGDSTGLFLRPATGLNNGGNVKEAIERHIFLKGHFSFITY
jgi:hypothetical protein